MSDVAGKFFLIVVCVALLVVGAVLVLFWPRDEVDEVLSPGAKGSAVNEEQVLNADGSESVRPIDDEMGDSREALPPTGLFIAGRVVEKGSALPVGTYGLSLYWKKNSQSPTWKKMTYESVRHEDGRFHLPVEEGGLYRLRISTANHLRGEPDDFEISEGTGIDTILIELDRGLAVSGRVVVDATDRPVADALVLSNRTSWRDRERLLFGLAQNAPHAVTDSDGRFRIEGLSSERQTIAALHPDFAQAGKKATPGETKGIEIRLKEGHCLFGKALGDDGRPAAGVAIHTAHREDQISRPVVTDREGGYRSPPVRPGLVQASARPPPDETEESIGFSSESKEVEVEDADREVNFGPSPEHVTLCGTLIGTDGTPQPGGTVFLTRVFVDPTKFNMRGANHYTGQCDGQGRFAIRKIMPGRFDVSAALNDGTFPNKKLTLSLEKPGRVEQDISFAGLIDPDATGVISGVVFDGATGAPLATEKVAFVMAYLSAQTRSFSDYLGGEGCFTIENLPAGQYRVFASVSGYPGSNHEDIELAKGQTIGNLILEIPAGGEMRLRVSGFGPDDPRELRVTTKHEENPGRQYVPFQIGDDGSWEHTWHYAVGKWTVTFSVDGLGFVEKSCTVVRGELVELLATRAEFETLLVDETVTVTGRVTYRDGQSAEGVTVAFYGVDVPGIDRAGRSKSGVTDSKGRYTVEGLGPGQWMVHVNLGDGHMISYPTLSIPRDPPALITHDLVLEGGTMSGILVDSLTGRKFDETGPEWWVFAENKELKRVVSQIQNGHRGPRFQLVGLPPGEYVITVNARGYKIFDSETIEHDGRGDVDLGRLGLEPSGIVDLAVTDNLGEKIGEYRVLFNGNNRMQWERSDLPNGRIRYDKLPLGEVEIEVHADGYIPAQTKVTTTLDRVEEVTVTLEPEQERHE